MLTFAYVALALLGCAYIVFAMVSGHADDAGGHGHDVTTGSAADYGVDHSGHSSVSAGQDAPGAFHFPFFSPLAVATLFACFGAYGLIGRHGLGLADSGSLGLAFPAALGTTYAISYASYRMMASSQGTSSLKTAQFTGADAEVITPIPKDGLGEVAAFVDGQRFTAPAREQDGRALKKGAHVTVVRMVGHTLVVSAGTHGEP